MWLIETEKSQKWKALNIKPDGKFILLEFPERFSYEKQQWIKWKWNNLRLNASCIKAIVDIGKSEVEGMELL